MKLIVQGKQMRISAGLRQYAEDHLLVPLQRFYDNEARQHPVRCWWMAIQRTSGLKTLTARSMNPTQPCACLVSLKCADIAAWA